MRLRIGPGINVIIAGIGNLMVDTDFQTLCDSRWTGWDVWFDYWFGHWFGHWFCTEKISLDIFLRAIESFGYQENCNNFFFRLEENSTYIETWWCELNVWCELKLSFPSLELKLSLGLKQLASTCRASQLSKNCHLRL